MVSDNAGIRLRRYSIFMRGLFLITTEHKLINDWISQVLQYMLLPVFGVQCIMILYGTRIQSDISCLCVRLFYTSLRSNFKWTQTKISLVKKRCASGQMIFILHFCPTNSNIFSIRAIQNKIIRLPQLI